MITSILIENFSHLAYTFHQRDGEYRDVDGFHPSQKGSKRIKLVLLFVIPAAISEEAAFLSLNKEDQDPNLLPRIASVRVPKGTPIYKVRGIIKFIEKQLTEIYGKASRLNFIMTCEDESENWSYVHHLPTYDVVYI
jgi:hypothetical protein